MQFGTPLFLCFLSLILTTATSNSDFEAHGLYGPLRERGGVLSINKSPPVPKDTPFGGIECSGAKKIYCQSRCHCSATGQIFCQKEHKKLAPSTVAFLETKLTAMCSPKCECKIDGGTIRGGRIYKQWSKVVHELGEGWGIDQQ